MVILNMLAGALIMFVGLITGAAIMSSAHANKEK